MKSRWVFVVVLLAGIGLIVTGFLMDYFESLWIASQAFLHPKNWLPMWNNPVVNTALFSFALILVGGLAALVGLIGVIETTFPRRDV